MAPGGFQARKSPQIPAGTGPGIALSRIKPVPPRFESPDHTKSRVPSWINILGVTRISMGTFTSGLARNAGVRDGDSQRFEIRNLSSCQIAFGSYVNYE